MFTSTKIKKHQRGGGICMMAAFALIYALLAQTAYAQSPGEWQTATGIDVEKSSRVYDTSTRVYYTLNTMTNNSGAVLNGPVRLVVASSSFPVTNASSTDANGKPYFDVLASSASLAKGAKSSATRINFQSTRATFAYTVEVQKWVEILDSDHDGIPDVSDMCPTDATNVCITINGQVLGNGAALTGSGITIGIQANNKTTLTDSIGKFEVIGLGNGQSAHDNLNDFFPVEVSAPGFSSGYAKVVFEPGKTSYDVTINLQPVSDNFTVDDNLNQGVEINKEGAAVGQLMIPDTSRPDGVTKITGSVTYLDPANDLQSAPGGDLLALPAGVDPNSTPVPLESYGMMEFDLKDQNGAPVHVLKGDAEVCMKATPGLIAGNTIPLWYYDKTDGLWKGEGQGTVVAKLINNVNTLMICGNVTHFTWWNYDQPINTHSCFKFDIRDETTGNRLSGSMNWQAEGVTYDGNSPDRACNLDNNDPQLPIGVNTIDSLTVKKSTATSIEQIRVFTYVGGSKYYLKRDGDGTYSLTPNQANATVFNTPSANASCLNNTNVDQCAFLDYLDANADGILPLSSNINYPPLISNFTVASSNLMVGASTAVATTVTDPEGKNVSVGWTTECSWYGPANPGTMSPTNQGPSQSPALYNASFTAPSTLTNPVEWCKITATATDSDGMTSSAEQWVYVTSSNQYVVEGTLYDTNGQQMPNTSIQHSYYDCTNSNYVSQGVLTDASGHYRVQFNVNNCSSGGYYDLGYLNINYMHDNIQRTRTEYLDNYSNIVTHIGCTVQPNAATQCLHDIRLPAVWGTLSGNLYPVQSEAITALYVQSSSYGYYGYSVSDRTSLNPQQGATSYGPISVPVGQTWMLGYTNNYNHYNSLSFVIPSTDGQHQDLGEATVPVTVKLFNNLGAAWPGVPVTVNSSNSSYNYYCSYINNYCNYTGTTDAQGEFIATLPLGPFNGHLDIPNHGIVYGYGYANTKDQPVNIDVNSPDSCTVTGVAYDSFGLPMAAGVTIYAYADGNYTSANNWNGSLQAVTGPDGRFVFTGVKPGQFYFTNTNSYHYSTIYAIDNCRPVNGGPPRNIRIDRPFVDAQYLPVPY